jgi:hypothetical protein
MDVDVAGAGDPEVSAFLEQHGMAVVARRGQLVDALTRPALIVVASDELVGVLTYDISGSNCEILALKAARRFSGIGSALVRAGGGRCGGCRLPAVLGRHD